MLASVRPERLPVSPRQPRTGSPVTHRRPQRHLAGTGHRAALRVRLHRILFILGLALVVTLFLPTVLRATATSTPPKPPATVTVQAGDTLWSIAEQQVGNGNRLDYIYRLKQANGLKRSDLQVGQVLVLP